MKKLHITIKYTEELLGTASANDELHSDYIASKAPDAMSKKEEVEALGREWVEEKGMTVFARTDDQKPMHWDYQWKGYFKEACGMLRRADESKSKKLKAYKKEIDGLLFVNPRKIPLEIPEGKKMGRCQRPLRAQTAQGERVALSDSETVPAGTTQSFDVVLLKAELAPLVIEWLEYGALHGTGQWRNSGKGRFVFTAKDENGKVIASNT